MPKPPCSAWPLGGRHWQRPAVQRRAAVMAAEPTFSGELTRKGTKFSASSSNPTVPPWPDNPSPLTQRPEQTQGPPSHPGGPEPGLGQAVPRHQRRRPTPTGSWVPCRAQTAWGCRGPTRGVNSRASGRRPCLRPGARVCGELGSRNADLSHTSGKSEPAGLEGAGRNPDPTPSPHPRRLPGTRLGRRVSSWPTRC